MAYLKDVRGTVSLFPRVVEHFLGVELAGFLARSEPGHHFFRPLGVAKQIFAENMNAKVVAITPIVDVLAKPACQDEEMFVQVFLATKMSPSECGDLMLVYAGLKEAGAQCEAMVYVEGFDLLIVFMGDFVDDRRTYSPEVVYVHVEMVAN